MSEQIKLWIVWLAAACVALTFVLKPLHRVAEVAEGKTVLNMVFGGYGREQRIWHELKKRFEETHPGVRLNLILSNTPRKIETMIAGGVAPDVIPVDELSEPYYVKAGALMPMRRFVRESEDILLDDYFPAVRQHVPDQGEIYWLPATVLPFLLFYNKDLFDKYGLDYPDPDWTWEDYRQLAIRLTRDKKGRTLRIEKRDEGGNVAKDALGRVLWADNPESDGKPVEFGLYFAWWIHGIENFIYQNGGTFVDHQRHGIDFLNPGAKGALEFVYAITFEDRSCISEAAGSGLHGADMFRAGKVGMNGPWATFSMPDYRKLEFDWDVVPLPKGPQGSRAAILAFGGYGISSQTKHLKEAFELVKFLTGDGQLVFAKEGSSFPSRRRLAQSTALHGPDRRPASRWVLLDALEPRDGGEPYARFPQWVGPGWADAQALINDKLTSMLRLGRPTPDEFATYVSEKGTELLQKAKMEEGRQFPLVNWHAVILAAMAVGIAGAGLILWLVRRRGPATVMRRNEQLWGYLGISPWLIGFLCFWLGPCLFSLVLSLCRWKSLGPLSHAQFVGFDNYTRLVGTDDLFWLSLIKATGLYTVLSVPLGLAFSFALALVMNAAIRGIRLFRTIFYLPAILPSVASAVLWWWMFDPNGGLVNFGLRKIGVYAALRDWMAPGLDEIPWLALEGPAMAAVIIVGLWGVGGSMIIYLAALQAIPTTLYDAAEVDGAGWWGKFRYVTLPMVSPVLFFNLVMAVIGSFQVFTVAYLLTGGGPNNATLFYVFYLFRKAFVEFDMGYGSAMAWILFLIILAVTLLVFKSSPLWVYYEAQSESPRSADRPLWRKLLYVLLGMAGLIAAAMVVSYFGAEAALRIALALGAVTLLCVLVVVAGAYLSQKRWGLYPVLGMLTIPILAPLLWLVSSSLKPQARLKDKPPDLLPLSKQAMLSIKSHRLPVRLIRKDGDKALVKLRRTDEQGIVRPVPVPEELLGERLTEQPCIKLGGRVRTVEVVSRNDDKIVVEVMPSRQRYTVPPSQLFPLKTAAPVLKVFGAEIPVQYDPTTSDTPPRGTRFIVTPDAIEVPLPSVEEINRLSPRIDNYIRLFKPDYGEPKQAAAAPIEQQTNFGLQFLNTLYLVVWCILGQVTCCSLVGYSFARLRFAGRDLLFILLLSTMMLPAQVTMIPQFILFKRLGWIDTYLPFIVPSFLGGSAFFIFLFRQHFLTMPLELEDAAKMDGCGPLGVFWHIMLPMAAPVVVVVMVFTFIGVWNDFMGPLIYINSESRYTLALGLNAFKAQHGEIHQHLLMAATTLMIVPSIIVFFVAQRAFIQGTVITGSKG